LHGSHSTELDSAPQPRSIRSYTLRNSRITAAQKRALREGWERYGLAIDDGPLAARRVFGRNAKLVVEIGFGNGESLLQQALADPDSDYLGVETHTPGVGHLLHRALELVPDNLKVYHADALDVLGYCIPPASIGRLQIYFPDPWPKKRHHKRRIVRPDTTETLTGALQPGALLHIATDWQPYAESIMQLLNSCPVLESDRAGPIIPRPAWRPETRFERRGLALRHCIFDILYEKRRGRRETTDPAAPSPGSRP